MNLKKSIRRQLLEMVTEGMDPSGLPDHKYYAFDWDDYPKSGRKSPCRDSRWERGVA